MRALLVNPAFPDSYWSGRYALPLARRRSLLPPLGLITVAALLPERWEMRLVDLDVEPLTDAHLSWADVVLVTGMIIQRTSLQEVLTRCRKMGVRTVVGGPYATALPAEMTLASHIMIGEGDDVIPVLAADLEAGRAQPVYRETEKPDLTRIPVPRYDLLKPGAYHQMSLQYSRGCPFSCEFCDIIVMYGRKPRVKASSQIVAELEAIRKTGFKGDVFFVDDNFIGNKKAAKGMIPEIARWREKTHPTLEFYTEASVNLADDEELVDMMTRSGFTAVFMGIETPDPNSLKETHKNQNLRRDLVEQVHWLLEKGLDVWAGFILGFDNDTPESFDRMIDFIQKAAIPYAMVGMLSALPNTPLYARLEKEGRLLPEISGDQFGMTNVVTRMPSCQMLSGYRRVLETLYHPEVYFQRCRENLARWNPARGAVRPVTWSDVASGFRALTTQGITGRYRAAYWQFLRWVVRHHPEKVFRAVAQAAAGHHYITYTKHVVVPGLTAKLPRLTPARPVLAT